ncbi:hypothetical protein GQ600_24696 [Phytophthora cactorum]|nr:hypothetical protein GQ600_24696 [Phytophthora cactorum]
MPAPVSTLLRPESIASNGTAARRSPGRALRVHRRDHIIQLFMEASSPPGGLSSSPDVMLHVGGCVFALHEEVLRLRWPWLHLQLQRLREHNNEPRTAFSLNLNFNWPHRTLISSNKELQNDDHVAEASAVHKVLRCSPPTLVPMMNKQFRTLNERSRQKETRKEKIPKKNWENRRLGNKRARKLFDNEMEIGDMSSIDKTRDVLHVELVGASAIAMVSVIEYVYTFKVRLLHNTIARETLILSRWVGMGDRIRYCCLKVAVRQVMLDTWMELLVATATLSKKEMRRNLSERLIDFLYELQPVQYQDAMDKIPTTWIQAIDDHDMLVRVLVALINNVPLVGFWRNLLDALVKWLNRRFESPQVPSLRAMHQHFVKDWEPYVELSRVECFTNTSSANSVPLHVILFEFGDFVLQACINAIGHRLCCGVLSDAQDSEVVVGSEALDGDPEFWIRGQLIVKYQPADQGGAVVTEDTQIEYEHCCHQYCKWKSLVSPSSTSTRTNPSDEGWAHYEDPVHNYYRRTVCTVSGKLFLWGDPICSLYHQLLQTTLFYCAPGNVSSDVGDILTVSEMQQLPVETLALVLCSDRLRIPEGERTLLRCLNKMVFGLDVYHVGLMLTAATLLGRVDDVTRLYRCVRWCFVPLDDIIPTLRWTPRTLKLYEIIVESLRDPNRSHKRRRPFGWRKFRDAYMTNETNLSEFEIEAGDLNLAPSGAASLTMLNSVLR